MRVPFPRLCSELRRDLDEACPQRYDLPEHCT